MPPASSVGFEQMKNTHNMKASVVCTVCTCLSASQLARDPPSSHGLHCTHAVEENRRPTSVPKPFSPYGLGKPRGRRLYIYPDQEQRPTLASLLDLLRLQFCFAGVPTQFSKHKHNLQLPDVWHNPSQALKPTIWTTQCCIFDSVRKCAHRTERLVRTLIVPEHSEILQ